MVLICHVITNRLQCCCNASGIASAGLMKYAIEPLFSIAQLALEKALGNVTIEDVVTDILEKERVNNSKI